MRQFPEETDRILSPVEVMSTTTLSRTTLWRLTKRRDFPAPVQLSPGRIGWRRSMVESWLAAREIPHAA